MEESLSLAGDTCGEVAELVKDSGEVDKKISSAIGVACWG